MLEGFVASSASDPMKLSALRSLSQAYAAEQNWERFGETTSRGLALAPTDAAFKNNAAYVLLVEQKKPQDALPLAQQAAELAPGDPNVLDTLAAVQWTLGQRDDALRTLSRAVRRYPTDLERAGALLKLGRWQLEADRRDAAAVTAGQLQELLVDDNAVRESLADEIGKFVQQAQPR
ncbi:tetratricopeptide repeat protein [Leptolyngbya sp. 15MV]|nr:tetratricopeptide repeat protein [Leptolyngbya sp. 15MV]